LLTIKIANKAGNKMFRNDDYCCTATPLWSIKFVQWYRRSIL